MKGHEMKYFGFAITLALTLIVMSGSARAADWTTEDGGSVSCGALKADGVCWLSAIAADSSAIVIRTCKTWTIMVYGTGANIMPQTCTDTSCGTVEDLLGSGLTGDSPNTFLASALPFEIVRIDWTAGGAAPTVSIKCGR